MSDSSKPSNQYALLSTVMSVVSIVGLTLRKEAMIVPAPTWALVGSDGLERCFGFGFRVRQFLAVDHVSRG